MRKLIIVDEGDIRELSFEELLDMYKPFVMRKIWDFRNLDLELDDRYQLATIGLWNAYTRYDASRMVGFERLATISINNKLKKAFDYSIRSKRSGVEVLSLDKEYQGRWQIMTLTDLLESDDDTEEEIILKSNLKEFGSKLTSRQKEAIELYSRCKNFREVARILGVGQSAISMRMTAARKIFNECMTN
jgi:RNA polymerase sigma factor (sigma-70 family)